MKCREFMESAEALPPWQMLRVVAEQQKMSLHAGECASCRRWLESQRSLDTALDTLRTATARREAGPAVEDAVLQAFRAGGFARRVVAMPERSAPAVWRLSRLFELGAYAAVAAALVVGLFLGARILRDKQTQQAAGQAEATSAPNTNQSASKTTTGSTKVADQAGQQPVRTPETRGTMANRGQASPVEAKTETGANDQSGYVAVMLCDPLICSGEEHVIRMELPATVTADGSTAQPVLADVVIGEDGLVRAMRIVNE